MIKTRRLSKTSCFRARDFDSRLVDNLVLDAVQEGVETRVGVKASHRVFFHIESCRKAGFIVLDPGLRFIQRFRYTVAEESKSGHVARTRLEKGMRDHHFA